MNNVLTSRSSVQTVLRLNSMNWRKYAIELTGIICDQGREDNLVVDSNLVAMDPSWNIGGWNCISDCRRHDVMSKRDLSSLSIIAKGTRRNGWVILPSRRPLINENEMPALGYLPKLEFLNPSSITATAKIRPRRGISIYLIESTSHCTELLLSEDDLKRRLNGKINEMHQRRSVAHVLT